MSVLNRKKLIDLIESCIDDLDRLTEYEMLREAVFDFENAEMILGEVKEKIAELIIAYIPADGVTIKEGV